MRKLRLREGKLYIQGHTARHGVRCEALPSTSSLLAGHHRGTRNSGELSKLNRTLSHLWQLRDIHIHFLYLHPLWFISFLRLVIIKQPGHCSGWDLGCRGTGLSVCSCSRGPSSWGCQHQAGPPFVTEVSVSLCIAGSDPNVRGPGLACSKPALEPSGSPRIPGCSPLITRTCSPADCVLSADVCHSDLGLVMGGPAGGKACVAVAISLLGWAHQGRKK